MQWKKIIKKEIVERSTSRRSSLVAGRDEDTMSQYKSLTAS